MFSFAFDEYLVLSKTFSKTLLLLTEILDLDLILISKNLSFHN